MSKECRAVVERPPGPVAPYEDRAAAEKSSLDLDVYYAKVLCNSKKLANYNDVVELAVRMAIGRDLGLSRTEAINSIITVEGKPAFTSAFVSARIKQSRRYNYRVLEKTAEVCRIQYFEWGEPCGIEVFTIEDAQRANLIKDKGAWRTYPASMLFARCITSGARTHCPDVLYGYHIYTPDEIGGSVVLPPEGILGGPEPLTDEQLNALLDQSQQSA